jgi:hypothetical protein
MFVTVMLPKYAPDEGIRVAHRKQQLNDILLPPGFYKEFARPSRQPNYTASHHIQKGKQTPWLLARKRTVPMLGEVSTNFCG